MFRLTTVLVAALLAGAGGAHAQKVVAEARGDLGKTAFVVKAPDGSEWVCLRITSQQLRDVREKSGSQGGSAVDTSLTTAQVAALTQALDTGSPPQSLKFRVSAGEIRSVSGSSGRYLIRERTMITSHIRKPATTEGGGKAPPAALLDALPGIVAKQSGRDEDR